MDNQPKPEELNISLTEKTVESKTIRVPWVLLDHPYAIVEDRHGRRRVRMKSRWKVFCYYAWSWTNIKWFLKQYTK